MPTMLLPYRENGVLKYTYTAQTLPTAHAEHQSQPEPEDEDASALIATETLSAVDLERFTATGRPMPQPKRNFFSNFDVVGAPLHPPQRYTDSSVIPVIVRTAAAEGAAAPAAGKRRRSVLGRLRGERDDDGLTVVYMPRGEYLKYFARDGLARYVGTEPERAWTREELDEKFAKYRKDFAGGR